MRENMLILQKLIIRQIPLYKKNYRKEMKGYMS